MLLTTELDKLSGTDWQLFFAHGARKAVLCGAGCLCDRRLRRKKPSTPRRRTSSGRVPGAWPGCRRVGLVILGQDPVP
mgnify:CR=1 FL=1